MRAKMLKRIRRTGYALIYNSGDAYVCDATGLVPSGRALHTPSVYELISTGVLVCVPFPYKTLRLYRLAQGSIT